MTDQSTALRLAITPGSIIPVDIETTASLASELRRQHDALQSALAQNSELDQKLAEMEKALGQAVEAMELSLWAINSIATDEEITAFDKSFKNATKALKGAA